MNSRDSQNDPQHPLFAYSVEAEKASATIGGCRLGRWLKDKLNDLFTTDGLDLHTDSGVFHVADGGYPHGIKGID